MEPKLWCFNPKIFATQSLKHEIFQTMSSVRSNNLCLKYQRFTPSGYKEIWIRKLEFVADTQVKELSLCHTLWFSNHNVFATQCRRP